MSCGEVDGVLEGNELWMQRIEVCRQWVFPDRCIVCGKLLKVDVPYVEKYFCEVCESGSIANRGCKRCGKPYGNQGGCIGCQEVPEGIESVRGLFPYIDFYKASVLRWKYKGIRKYAKGFGELMYDAYMVQSKVPVDLLIPVPIAPNRYEERGFNQALDLANDIGTRSGLPVYDILRRTASTKPQSACTKVERARNIRNTIGLTPHIPIDRTVNIGFIDDIYTTGSTVKECLRVLKEVYEDQIGEVYVLAVCLAV